MYLHRILQLPEEDPVLQMFRNEVQLCERGESNWWTQVGPLLERYGLPDVDVIKNLSKHVFK